MLGWKLFRHALLMIVQNWQDAIKITLAPVVILSVIVLAFLSVNGLFSLPWDQLLTDPEAVNLDSTFGLVLKSGSFWLSLVAMVIAGLFVNAGMIVNWHRFILLEEYPSWWHSPFRSKQLLPYIMLGMFLFFFAFIIMIVLMVAAGAFAAAVQQPAVILILMLLIGSPVYVLIIRSMIALPSRAADTGYSTSQTREATKGQFVPILVGLVLLGLFGAGLDLVQEAILRVSTLFGILTGIVFIPINLLLFASFLTTLYGHYIQKRDLM